MTAQNIKFYNFDWDDNILMMPTNIIVFNKNDHNQEIAITTEEYAVVRGIVGKNIKDVFNVKIKECNNIVEAQEVVTEFNNIQKIIDKLGSLENFAHSYEFKNGVNGDKELSFREFRDVNPIEVNKAHHDALKKGIASLIEREEETFIKDLKNALENNKLSTSWKDFVEAVSTQEGAERTTIITARGQSPYTIYEGLHYLKEQGLINYVPPVKNLFPVSHQMVKNLYKDVDGVNPSNPSQLKQVILCDILDRVEEISKNCHKTYLCGFSDDDKKTYLTIKEALEKHIERWKNVKISLFFTEQSKEKDLYNYVA